MNVFSAPAGTYLYHRDHGRLAVIVGFAYVQANLAFPIYGVPTKAGIGPLECIEHPEGYISYPAKSRMFESLADWSAFVEDMAEEGEETVAAGTAPDPSPIVFGDKTNKTKSFWHWPTANAVFEIEGETALPNDPRVKKVKRDEFFDLKRDGAVKIDPHAGVIEEEPETVTEEDDDDDDSSVI